MKGKHIEIRAAEERVEVIVDDYELFDYVDDLLTGKGLEHEFTSEEERDGRIFYKMHFSGDVTQAQLSGVIATIPRDEIERIWQMNN